MDPELARRHLARDKPVAQRAARAHGLDWSESADGLIIYLSKTIEVLDLGEVTFLARLDCSGYDLSPPSLQFCNPQHPSECGRQWWVRSTHPDQNVITAHGVTGNCVRGTAEYYSAFHKGVTQNRSDWRLARLVRSVGNLLDPRYVRGRGV